MITDKRDHVCAVCHARTRQSIITIQVFTVHTDVIWDNFTSICGADWGRTTIKLHSILSLEGESDSLKE